MASAAVIIMNQGPGRCLVLCYFYVFPNEDPGGSEADRVARNTVANEQNSKISKKKKLRRPTGGYCLPVEMYIQFHAGY